VAAGARAINTSRARGRGALELFAAAPTRGALGSKRLDEHLRLSRGSATKPDGEEGVSHYQGCSSAGNKLGCFEDVQRFLD
jgi:hypothetical protein